jgi:hypothetical protein
MPYNVMPLSIAERNHLEKLVQEYDSVMHSGLGLFPTKLTVASRFDALLVILAMKIALSQPEAE